jgi:hypothetical protein
MSDWSDFDQEAMLRVIRPGETVDNQSVSDIVKSTIREARLEMEGDPADEVLYTLTSRLQERIPGIAPNEAELRRIAQAIADGFDR